MPRKSARQETRSALGSADVQHGGRQAIVYSRLGGFRRYSLFVVCFIITHICICNASADLSVEKGSSSACPCHCELCEVVHLGAKKDVQVCIPFPFRCTSGAETQLVCRGRVEVSIGGINQGDGDVLRSAL
jgi:hypothetical protein